MLILEIVIQGISIEQALNTLLNDDFIVSEDFIIMSKEGKSGTDVFKYRVQTEMPHGMSVFDIVQLPFPEGILHIEADYTDERAIKIHKKGYIVPYN